MESVSNLGNFGRISVISLIFPVEKQKINQLINYFIIKVIIVYFVDEIVIEKIIVYLDLGLL